MGKRTLHLTITESETSVTSISAGSDQELHISLPDEAADQIKPEAGECSQSPLIPSSVNVTVPGLFSALALAGLATAGCEETPHRDSPSDPTIPPKPNPNPTYLDDPATLTVHWPLTCNTFADVGSDLSTGRSGPASVVDCYGALQMTRDQEARFWGARRVDNFVADDVFSSGWSIGPSVTKRLLSDVGPYRQRRNVYEFSQARGTSYLAKFNIGQRWPGTYAFSVYVGGYTSLPVQLQIQRSSDAVIVAEIGFTPPQNGLARYAVSAELDEATASYDLIIRGQDRSQKIKLACAQLERIQGQVGAPNEYVPRGSALDGPPWNGANVDGVRYFDYFNPCSLIADGEVVSSETPTPIPADVIKGYMLGPTRANRWWSSRDFAAPQWSKINVTSQSAMIGSVMLGPATLRKVEETSDAGLHRIWQPWRGVLPGTINRHGQTVGVQLTVSIHIDHKRIDRNRALVLGFVDTQGQEHKAIVDVASRRVLNEMGGKFTYYRSGYPDASDVTYKTHVTEIGDLLRVSFTDSCGTGSLTPVGFIGLADVSSDTPVESYAGVVGAGLYIGAMQFERTDHGMLYLGDTGSSSSFGTGSDTNEPYFPEEVGQLDWSVYCEVTTLYDTDSPAKTSWDDIWYARQNSDDLRWGCAIRPGLYGGAGPEDHIKQPVFDIFAGPDGTGAVGGKFDVANVSYSSLALQTSPWQLSLASAAVDGSSNIRMYVGAKQGSLDSNGTHIVNKSSIGGSFHIGYRQGAIPYGEKCVKNFRILKAAATWEQMAAAANLAGK
ncbi:hypothetical protein [Hydrocarboniphaga effusa]|uniref:Uncharacterized protein n=1 Tax=Hydrocarboniphaga effusa AP103 TaxID=1172194 RepID=I7ZBN9_9GAMM|nr:hypothetical protein [Hydrocarboniphaga effusa]EIT69052.1 hypothetical protein WQQ_26340 [Hydrocarboniphaga effusa AP103]